jgi:hypothetical protein
MSRAPTTLAKPLRGLRACGCRRGEGPTFDGGGLSPTIARTTADGAAVGVAA